MLKTEGLLWRVDECSVYFGRLHLRGWCFHPADPVARVEIRFQGASGATPLLDLSKESGDVAAHLGAGARNVRFDEWISAPGEYLGQPFDLLFWLRSGKCVVGVDGLTNAAIGDPYVQIWENFLDQLNRLPGGAVLEIGSRARSGITRRDRVGPQFEYVGLDILPGPNVSVVGDAHRLSRVFPQKRFVAAFSFSVFEHLAMPWQVAVEANRVLEPGALMLVVSHQSWPIHEPPYDFWRFSSHTWPTLFNPRTGFRILESAMGDPARIYANRAGPVTRALAESPAWLGSACIVQKTGETNLDWDVSVGDVTESTYPPGETDSPLARG